MRLEVRYPDGTSQIEERAERLIIVGRDPSCDLILRDPKCSRRHAVFEETPEGVQVRDTGSVNGVFVNGLRVERSLLQAGDEVRLGEVRLSLAPAEAERPLVASLSSPLLDLPLPDSQVLDAPAAANDNRRASGARPLAVTVLATLWLGVTPLCAAGAVAAVIARGPFDLVAALVLAGGALAGLVAALLGGGLFLGQRWARTAHLALCLPLALSCIAAPLALVAAAYLLGRRAQGFFSGGRPGPAKGAPLDRIEIAFALGLVASALVTLGGAALAGYLLREPLSSLAAAQAPQDEPVRAHMRAMANAQESFRRVCNVGFADMEGLLDPARVIPGYPPRGAAFLSPADAAAESHGYRFGLLVRDPMPPTDDCQTLRRYRSYEYRGTPLLRLGRHYLLTSDGVLHVAQGRAARPDDPAVETSAGEH